MFSSCLLPSDSLFQAGLRYPYGSQISQNFLCDPFSRAVSGRCIYHQYASSKCSRLHSTRLIIFPTQSCLYLQSYWTNQLHLKIMCLIVSSLFEHSLHLLYSCFPFILTFIQMLLMALFSANIESDFVSLLSFHQHSHVNVNLSVFFAICLPYNCFSCHFFFKFLIVAFSGFLFTFLLVFVQFWLL